MLDHRRRASESGEPLVLLHYQGGHAHSWDPVADRLEGRFELWQIALPGYGSSPPLVRPPTMAALADAVEGFMADQGVHRFHVAGCSLGGGVALELGRRSSALSVCALSPAGFAEGWDMAFLQSSLATYPPSCRAILPTVGVVARSLAGRRALLWQMSTRPERTEPGHLEALVRSVASAPGYAATSRNALRERFRGGLEITCPVTVAWAEDDRLLLTGRQRPRAMGDLPQAEHLLLTGCGHLPFYDDTDQVAEVVSRAAGAG